MTRPSGHSSVGTGSPLSRKADLHRLELMPVCPPLGMWARIPGSFDGGVIKWPCFLWGSDTDLSLPSELTVAQE